MSTRLHYVKPNNLSQLHDEILAAIPALRPTDEGPVMVVEGLDDDIYLTVPDGTDEPSIAAVVAAHIPRDPLTPTIDQREREEAEAQLLYATDDTQKLAALSRLTLGR
jgi:hypothetical protein